IRGGATRAEWVLRGGPGALLLAKAGRLAALEATTHPVAIDFLRQVAPKTTVPADRRFVDNGRVVCSAGIAAGIDMSLHVVSRLLGRELAENTARQMEDSWQALPARPFDHRTREESAMSLKIKVYSDYV